MSDAGRTGFRTAVFLDRDGVLIAADVRDGVPHPPARAADVRVLPGVREACDALHQAGFLLVVVTNQPDVARGTATVDDVEAINAALRSEVAVDDLVMCLHDDADGCACRKPAPGMLLQAAERWGVDLASSVMVGDRWRDIAAGRSAGCRTIFVERGYSERGPQDQDLTVSEFPDAVPWIMAVAGRGGLSAPCRPT